MELSELPIEKQFELYRRQEDIRRMSTEEIKQNLLETYKEMLLQQNEYQEALKRRWNIAP
jgi:hypothetical protein